MYKTWFMGTLDSVTCTSAIFAWWKVRGSKFAQPPDGGVFGSEALPEGWCVPFLRPAPAAAQPAARPQSALHVMHAAPGDDALTQEWMHELDRVIEQQQA